MYHTYVLYIYIYIYTYTYIYIYIYIYIERERDDAKTSARRAASESGIGIDCPEKRARLIRIVILQ